MKVKQLFISCISCALLCTICSCSNQEEQTDSLFRDVEMSSDASSDQVSIFEKCEAQELLLNVEELRELSLEERETRRKTILISEYLLLENGKYSLTISKDDANDLLGIDSELYNRFLNDIKTPNNSISGKRI
ncbi:MAG: hypothetical protein NC186_08485 [Prevotella sp.]|nr:hypothetical protein [Prevotella sp.]